MSSGIDTCSQKMRVLFVEDNAREAEVVVGELRAAGYDVVWTRVDSESAFLAELEPVPERILADYSATQPAGNVVLEFLHGKGFDIPFILISGTLGKDAAVESFWRGADDYLVHDRLGRLGSALLSALENKRLRDSVRKAESTARESEIAFRKQAETQRRILDALPVQIALLDRDGVITAVNEAWRHFAAVNPLQPPDPSVGSNYLEGCESAKGDCSEQAKASAEGIRRVLRGELPSFSLEYPCPCPQEESCFRLVVTKTSSDMQAGVVVMHIDVTERKEAEAKLVRLNRLKTVGSSISEAIIRVHDRQELYEAACRIAVEQGLLRMAYIAEVEQETGIGKILASYGETGTYLDSWAVNVREGPLSAGVMATAVQTGRSDICNDLATDARMRPWQDAARTNGFSALAAFPIKTEGRSTGALVLMAGEVGYFQADEIELMEGVAANLSFALDAMLQEKQRLTAERLRQAVYEISSASEGSKTLGELYKAVHITIAQVMPAKNFYIALRSGRDSETLQYPYFVDEKSSEHRSTGSGGLSAYVLRTGSSLLCTHEREEELARMGEVVIGIPSAIWLGASLKIGDEIIGVMAVQDYENGRAYGETEQMMLEYVSSQVARAIDKKRTDEQRDLQVRVMEAAANAIVITDRNGAITWVNPAFTTLTGYTFVEAVGQDPKILNSGQQSPSFYQEMWNTLLRGEVWRGELVNRKKDGQLYAEQMTITPVNDETGTLSHFIAVKEDVSKARELEEQLRKAQKMEAIGRLSAGIAHDFNNQLSVILGFTELLEGEFQSDSRAVGRLEQVHKATERAADLTRQLLAFSRQQVMQTLVLDLNAVICEVEKMLRRLIGEDIELIVALAPDLGRIKADPTQIDQVIMNLAVNSRDAMPDGGRLTIETSNVEFDGKYTASHFPAQPGSYVMLAISDNGIGMDAATQSRIFEPFFTTKEMGKGTGLGLSTVYGVVKQCGGFIWVYSEPRQGTTFKIYLPRVIDALKPKFISARIEVAPSGCETVLLVEDTVPILDAVRELLIVAGYTVLASASPVEAIRIAEQHATPPSLLITDLVMPEMSGRGLADRLKAIYPAMKVIFMSGYTGDTALRLGIGETDRTFIQKPFKKDELLRKVRESLDLAD